MRALPLAPLVLVASLLQCTDLPQLQSGVCGNAVVETGEDCDTYPVGVGTYCRPPGSPAGACRFDCTTGSGHSCPSGWGCGTDGICRQPTGTFRQANGPVAANAWRLLTGDFDGKGRQDVFVRAAIDGVGQSSSRIHYYQPNPDHSIGLADTLVLPAQIASPVLADFNQDQKTDLGCVIDGGIDVMLGQSDRTLSPVAYPAYTLPGAQVAIAELTEYNITPVADLVVFTSVPGMPSAVSLATTGTQSASIFYPSPKGPADLAGPMITAAFVEAKAQEACDQLVVAFTGATGVDVYSPCTFQGTGIVPNVAGPIAHVSLPVGFTVAQGVRAGDVDGDTHLDLLIGTNFDSTYWARGDGTGAFGAATKLVVGTVGALNASIRLPVAVGDLNADGKADFVAPTGIYVSNPFGTSPYVKSVQKSAGLWTEGAIADLNADNLPDVVAASNTELDVDFYVGNGSLELNPFTISTSGTVSQLAVGDFDGDRVNDVAIAEAPADPTLPNDVSIAWGQAAAQPLPPARVGQFATVTQTVALPRPFTTLSDLAVVAVAHPPNAPSTTLISELLANGGRQPIAPYFLVQGNPDLQDTTIGIAAAPFLGTKNVDIAAIGYEPSGNGLAFHYWIAPAMGDAQFGPPVASNSLPSGFLPYITVGDVQRDEALVSWGKLVPGSVPWFVAAAPNATVTTSAFLPGQASPGKTPTMNAGTVIPFDVDVSPEGQLEFRDVDLDGAEDAVLLTGANIGMRSLYVAWNDGKGNFSTSRALQVNSGNDTPEGFAFVSADTSGVPRIAYVTRHALILATVDTKGRAISARTTLLATVSATGVAAGDVDGDGVQDLAVADEGNVTILRDFPVLE
jgi:hypothetical protein